MGFYNAEEKGRPVTIKDEGVTLASNVNSIDFTGVGVSGSAIGSAVTEEIPGGGAVSSVSNSNSTLTISPSTGAVIASLNLANANTWTVGQSFQKGAGSQAGYFSDTTGSTVVLANNTYAINATASDGDFTTTIKNDVNNIYFDAFGLNNVNQGHVVIRTDGTTVMKVYGSDLVDNYVSFLDGFASGNPLVYAYRSSSNNVALGGSTYALNVTGDQQWDSTNIYAGAGSLIIKPNLRQLLNSAGAVVLNWENGLLYDSSEIISLGIQGRILRNSSDITSLNWSSANGMTAFVPFLLRTGSATANTFPLKFTSGALLTTPVVGVEEFLSDKRFITISTGTSRKEYAINDSALTSGRVPYVTTNGRLTDLSTFLFNGTNLSIGTTASSALIHAVKTTEQMRLGFDTSNYFSTTVSANGDVLLSPNGTSNQITITPETGFNAVINFAPNGANKYGAIQFKSRGGSNEQYNVWAMGANGRFRVGSNDAFDILTGSAIGTGNFAWVLKSSGTNSMTQYNSAGVVTNVVETAGTTYYKNTGQFMIGDSTLATAKFGVLSTTEQVRILYDASNYFSTTVSATGNVTFNAVGSGAGFVFSDRLSLSSIGAGATQAGAGAGANEIWKTSGHATLPDNVLMIGV